MFFIAAMALSLCLVLSSCDDDDDERKIEQKSIVNVNGNDYYISVAGFFEANVVAVNEILKVNVTKKTTVSNTLLVVNVDEISDTIQTSHFTKEYPVTKNSWHTVSIEAGKREDGIYSVYTESKNTVTLFISNYP